MQTKSSYRALKWTLFMGMAASLASACVVSTGDGDDTDVPIDGGDGGTKSTAGTKATGGTKAGTNAGGTSAGTSTAGTSSAGTSAGGGTGGTTAADPDYPGVCDSSLKEPSVISAAACDASDNDNDCGACLKMNCCDKFKACYGKEPTSACGYGPSPAKDLGQFDCIVACYERDNDGVADETAILEGCQAECLNQCEATDDFVNEDTLDLMICARNGADDDPMKGNDDCNDVCFPPPM